MPLSNLWQQPAEDSDSASASDGLCAAEELALLRRQVKTFRARCASRLSRQKRRLEQDDSKYDATKEFQHTYFKSRVSWTWGTRTIGWRASVPDQTPADRRRAIWLYFKSLVSALNSLFLGRDPAQEQQDKQTIAHVISINVADDTDIKLSSGLFRSVEVRSIFNCIQQHVVVSNWCSIA